MSSYITAILEGDEEPMDELGRGAVVALGHIIDGTATRVDLDAYRAWITWLRLSGASEHDIQSSVAVADHLAHILGVA